MKRTFVTIIAISLALAVPASVFASGGGGGGGVGTFAGVSLSVSKETAPPGGMAQIKVFMTEPKPISTSGGTLTFGAFDTIYGISLGESIDAAGIALVRGNTMSIAVISPSATYGTLLDYPILAIAGHVPDNSPIGTKYPVNVDPASLTFTDATGTVYPTEIKQGFLVTGTGVAIGDVNPGSDFVPAGGVVTLTGSNFNAATNIKFANTKISTIQYVSPTRIDVTLALPTTMYGTFIKAANPDGTQATYYSYQRTRPVSPSLDPVMQYAYPLFPPASVTTSSVPLPVAAANTTYGVALQNIGSADVHAFVELLDTTGTTIASTSITVPPSKYIVRELNELFAMAPATGGTIRVTGDLPVQVIGIAADQVNGTAKPILAK